MGFAVISKAIKIATRFISISFWTWTFWLFILFFLQSPDVANIWAFLYRLSIPVYYFLGLWLLTIILSPLYFSKYLKYLLIFPKVLFDTFLLADYFVFKIYRFHIDMMFINMAISDFKGIGLSPLMVLISVFIFIMIGFVNYRFFRWAEKHRIFKLKPVLISLVFLFLFGQLTHIWANAYKQAFIQQYTPYFPYYFPTTSSSLMKKMKKNYAFLLPKPLEKPSQNLDLSQHKQGSNLFAFPLHPLQFKDTLSRQPKILVIALESWRADFLNKEATPFLDSLSQRLYRYDKHYSSGNVTVSGIFGLLYGLHPTYWQYVQSKPYDYPSLLYTSLKRQNYEVGVYTSSNLDRFSLKAMLFPGIDKKHYINFTGQRADKNDRKVVDKLVADIKKDSLQKWFKFVFLTSSHHHYFYPDKYKIFTPVPDNSEGFILNNEADPQPYINRYKNALRYEDDLLKEVISALQQTGQYQNTLIFITGDHAEEFNDNKKGYWGHGSNFTKYQTHVPLLVHLPGKQKDTTINRMTTHVDIVPSILQAYLGVANPLVDYTSGKNLLDTVSHIGLIQTSYKDKSYLIHDKVYQTGLFVKSYDVNDIQKINKKYDYKAINKLRQEEYRFLKAH